MIAASLNILTVNTGFSCEKSCFPKMATSVCLPSHIPSLPWDGQLLHEEVGFMLPLLKPEWRFVTPSSNAIWWKWGRVTSEAGSQEIIEVPPDCVLGHGYLEPWAAGYVSIPATLKPQGGETARRRRRGPSRPGPRRGAIIVLFIYFFNSFCWPAFVRFL